MGLLDIFGAKADPAQVAETVGGAPAQPSVPETQDANIVGGINKDLVPADVHQGSGEEFTPALLDIVSVRLPSIDNSKYLFIHGYSPETSMYYSKVYHREDGKQEQELIDFKSNDSTTINKYIDFVEAVYN